MGDNNNSTVRKRKLTTTTTTTTTIMFTFKSLVAAIISVAVGVFFQSLAKVSAFAPVPAVTSSASAMARCTHSCCVLAASQPGGGDNVPQKSSSACDCAACPSPCDTTQCGCKSCACCAKPTPGACGCCQSCGSSSCRCSN